jgi:hypothetical protein
MRKRLFVPLALAGIIAAAAFGVSAALSSNPQTGNGAPSGKHFDLQIHGVNGGQGYNGNTKNNIFVPLQGNCRISLTEGSPFSVLQNDCINNPPAEFQLPDPCGGDTTCTNFVYEVFARALTKGSANMFTCFTDTTGTFCATGAMVVSLNKIDYGKFVNVSQSLLNVCNLAGKKEPLFADSNKDEFWEYDNSGLRLAQLRFYPIATPSGIGSGCTFTQVS